MAGTQEQIAMVEAAATAYSKGVLSGDIKSCRWVRLAVERDEKDRKTADERGLYFDKKKATHAVLFFGYLKLWKGKRFKNTQFVLSPHFLWITWVLMGWYKSDGTRRFNTAYVEMGRKGAKSSYAGGLGAYFFVADGEQGAEIYSAAVKRDQAKIVWENVYNFLKRSPFKHMVRFYKDSMSIQRTLSKCLPLSSDSKSLDGLDTHFASIDELHAHPDRRVYDLIVDSCDARDQALIFIITTAGFDQTGICYQTREYLTNILRGHVDDDSFFGVIFTLDTKRDWQDLKTEEEYKQDPTGEKEDDWTDEETWVKAMPGLYGITKQGTRLGLFETNSYVMLGDEGTPIPGYMTSLDKVRNKFKVAISNPAAQNNFLTKRMNIWTSQATRWLDLSQWDQNFSKEVYIEAA